MPLDNEKADEVVFACESCGREQALGELRKLNGACQKCGETTWRMRLEFHEGPPSMSPVALVMTWVFGVQVIQRVTEIIKLEIPNIPGADAADIAKLGWDYKRGAFHYMEMRRELDAATEREAQKANGARNCLRCGFFYMPAADKPWTSAGYCSKGCLGSPEGKTDLPGLPIAPQSEITIKQSSRTISLKCNNGHPFEVAAMYVGTIRPCPICQRMTEVSVGA